LGTFLLLIPAGYPLGTVCFSIIADRGSESERGEESQSSDAVSLARSCHRLKVNRPRFNPSANLKEMLGVESWHSPSKHAHAFSAFLRGEIANRNGLGAPLRC
jgi:hypothetical protein